MAEDDDDASFGDFTFASNSSSIQFNQQNPTSFQNNGPKSTIEENGDDDEWGDFVETPLGSAVSSWSLSKPINGSFNFFDSQPQLKSASFNGFESEKKKKTNNWVKPKGAIPLSIFGEEEKENDSQDNDGKNWGINLSSSNYDNGSKGNGYLGVGMSYDVIANLYNNTNQKINLDNGLVSNVNVLNMNNNGIDSNKKGANLMRSGASLDLGSDTLMGLSNQNQKVNVEDGSRLNGTKSLDFDVLKMDFSGWNIGSDSMGSDTLMGLSNQNQKVNVEDGLRLNGTKSLDFDVLKMDFSGWNIGSDSMGSHTLMGLSNQNQKVNVEDGSRLNGTKSLDFDVLKMDFSGWNTGSDSKSDSGMIGRDSNKIELNKAKSGGSQSNLNGLELDLTQKKSSDFDGWKFGFDRFKPDSNVMNRDLKAASSNANGDPGDDDDDGGWDFKDAFSESKASPGNEKAESKEGNDLEANTNSKEFVVFVKDSNRSIDLFSMSSGPFDLFATSNGTSGSSYNIAVGLDSKPNTAAQNGSDLDTYLRKYQTESKVGVDSLVGNTECQEDFGEFAAAFEEPAPTKEAEQRLHESAGINSTSEFTNFSNGSTDFFAGLTGSIDLFAQLNGNPNDLNKVDFKVDTSPSVAPKVEAAHTVYSLEMSSISEKTNDRGELDSHLVVGDAVFDDDFGEFTTASTESAGKPEVMEEMRAENHKRPLPLSIFCDEEPEIDGSLDIPNAFLDQSESFKRNNHSSNTTSSISEIISNLYAQAEPISSVDNVNKATQNGSFPSEHVLNPSVEKDIDDSSLEFKDASLERGSENGTSLHNNGHADDGSCSTQLKLKRYVDFYSKLMDMLQFLAKCHLESLKEAQTTTTASEDANLAADIEEIQEACSESSQKNSTSKELEDSTGKESDIIGLLNFLQEPGFDILESEYSLQTELNLVRKDSKATVQLIKHAKTMLKLLSLGSAEEQLTYVSAWSKMISLCTEELRGGAQIWKQSLEKNLQSQILADSQGKKFLLSLGEVYRVAIILEASIKLYKPWTLLSSIESSSSMYHLLDECHALWRSSGLEEAVLSISVSSSPDGDNSASSLLDSIKHTRDLDVHTLENNVFDSQQPLCRLSLLTSSVVPGMAFVEWGGMQSFVKLANLWANLISNDIPKLPSLLVDC